jgi:hypothetical protein
MWSRSNAGKGSRKGFCCQGYMVVVLLGLELRGLGGDEVVSSLYLM